LLVLSVLSTHSVAGEAREIILHDGSLISAEIVSLRDGVYTLRTDSLGTITIEASKIRTIRLHSATTPPHSLSAPASRDVATQIKGLEQTMTSDPAIMGLLTSLLQHPEAQAVLSDPVIMQAVRTHDFQTLLAHPGFVQLLNNPVVQEISRRLSP
jgi:hypothetical protein